MKVLITGGSGFIGSRLTEQLLRYSDIKILSVYHITKPNTFKGLYKKKFKIVKIFSDVDIMYSKSYYKMIYLEYLILNLINIIKIN